MSAINGTVLARSHSVTILDKITSDLPRTLIDPNIKQKLKSFVLSDTTFDIPNPINILVGTDLFTNALTGDRHTLSPKIHVALGSIFDYVKMGTTPSLTLSLNNKRNDFDITYSLEVHPEDSASMKMEFQGAPFQRRLYFSSHPPVYEKDTKIFVWNCALHSARDVVFDWCAHAHIGGVGEEGGTARNGRGIAGDLAIFNSRHRRSNTTRSSPATSRHPGDAMEEILDTGRNTSGIHMGFYEGLRDNVAPAATCMPAFALAEACQRSVLGTASSCNPPVILRPPTVVLTPPPAILTPEPIYRSKTPTDAGGNSLPDVWGELDAIDRKQKQELVISIGIVVTNPRNMDGGIRFTTQYLKHHLELTNVNIKLTKQCSNDGERGLTHRNVPTYTVYYFTKSGVIRNCTRIESLLGDDERLFSNSSDLLYPRTIFFKRLEKLLAPSKLSVLCLDYIRQLDIMFLHNSTFLVPSVFFSVEQLIQINLLGNEDTETCESTDKTSTSLNYPSTSQQENVVPCLIDVEAKDSNHNINFTPHNQGRESSDGQLIFKEDVAAYLQQIKSSFSTNLGDVNEVAKIHKPLRTKCINSTATLLHQIHSSSSTNLKRGNKPRKLQNTLSSEQVNLTISKTLVPILIDLCKAISTHTPNEITESNETVNDNCSKVVNSEQKVTPITSLEITPTDKLPESNKETTMASECSITMNDALDSPGRVTVQAQRCQPKRKPTFKSLQQSIPKSSSLALQNSKNTFEFGHILDISSENVHASYDGVALSHLSSNVHIDAIDKINSNDDENSYQDDFEELDENLTISMVDTDDSLEEQKNQSFQWSISVLRTKVFSYFGRIFLLDDFMNDTIPAKPAGWEGS
uniref:Uncharacterized protein n=1 Tax=Timema monikensis TaxID=170555 RepID=A0A7R9E2Q3_9NEOP|nr:unnamed protein product [Timema monikensis]